MKFNSRGRLFLFVLTLLMMTSSGLMAKTAETHGRVIEQGPDFTDEVEKLMDLYYKQGPPEEIYEYATHIFDGYPENIEQHYFDVQAQAALIVGVVGYPHESEKMFLKSMDDGGYIIQKIVDLEFDTPVEDQYYGHYLFTLDLRKMVLEGYWDVTSTQPEYFSKLHPEVLLTEDDYEMLRGKMSEAIDWADKTIKSLSWLVVDEKYYGVQPGEARAILE